MVTADKANTSGEKLSDRLETEAPLFTTDNQSARENKLLGSGAAPFQNTDPRANHSARFEQNDDDGGS